MENKENDCMNKKVIQDKLNELHVKLNKVVEDLDKIESNNQQLRTEYQQMQVEYLSAIDTNKQLQQKLVKQKERMSSIEMYGTNLAHFAMTCKQFIDDMPSLGIPIVSDGMKTMAPASNSAQASNGNVQVMEHG